MSSQIIQKKYNKKNFVSSIFFFFLTISVAVGSHSVVRRMKQTGSKTLFPVQWLMEGKLLRKVLNGFPARRALSLKQCFFPLCRIFTTSL